MIATFYESNYEPFILVNFPDGSTYRYEGFELGFFHIIRKKFYKKPGKLIQYLKSLKFIRCKKMF